jgi:hypothetical protein
MRCSVYDAVRNVGHPVKRVHPKLKMHVLSQTSRESHRQRASTR